MQRERLASVRLLAIAVLLATGAARDASAAAYRVGPGHPLATPSNVPWESLAAGDSVLIHWRAMPYRDKWVINRAGTEAAPIVVRGIADPATGALPVIDGQDAVTRAQLNFWGENRGVIKIGGSNVPPDGMPEWIVIEDLEIRNAHTPYTFTGRSGVTAYAGNAAAIYAERGQHVTIRGCRLTACGNGMFAAAETSDLLVEGCTIDGNGNVGSIYEHNNYTEARGATFQFNRFAPLLAGAGGNNLKDRSAGTVVRYNWIEGGNRQLDLVESDFAELIDDPRYRTTFVYGNVLIERDGDGNSQVCHYGGDNGGTASYRKGTLYFHHNTLVSRRAGNTTLLRLSTDDESADVRDNILYVTAAGNRLAMLDSDGSLLLTRNWLKTGWVGSHSGGAPNIVNAGQVTGTSPGFADEAGEDFALAETSPCLDQAVALDPACVPDHVPILQYVKHRASAPRVTTGAAADLGAFERMGAVSVGGPAGPGGTGLALRATPNPARGSMTIELPGVDTRAPLEVLDARGRLRARVAAAAPGRWALERGGLAPGLYLVRLGALSQRITLLP
jgi:hypothetical protein